MKTVPKRNKAASRLKTVLKKKSIPGLHLYMTQRPRSGITTMTSCKRLSFRVTSEVNKIRQEAFGQILPVFQKELGYVYLHNMAWLKSLKKDSIHKKIMATRDDYVNNNMFDLDEVIAVAVHKRNFLLKRLLEDQGRFPEQ